MKVRHEIENSIRCYRVLHEGKRGQEIPPDNSAPIFIQEKIIVYMYSLYINKD
jgi:hypothetical protein